jgi:hypothetical protein
VSTHPRPPSSAACSHPLALLGAAGLAASRLASPCAARPACRRRWLLRTLLRQWAWKGGQQAMPAPQRSPRPAAAQGGGQPPTPTAQQLHLVGEPWRPRSWPSTTAAALAGGGSSGLACRWLGTRIGVGPVRLLARPSTAVGTAGRVPRPSSTAGGVSHPIPIVSRSRRSGRPHSRLLQRRRACRPDDDPAPRLHDAVALSVQRHGDPANPGWTAAGRRGWLGSPSATGQRMLAATARVPPSGGASVRSPADHRPFRRSAARSSVDHPPLGGAAGAGPRDTKEATRRPRRAAAPIPRCSEGSRCATRSSHPVRQPQEPRTREQHPAPDRAAAPSRPDTYPAAGRSDPWVTVAGPAGPAPPAATCGRPEARPASA